MSHHQKKTCAIHISNLCIRIRSLQTFVCWASEVAQQGKPLVSMPDHLCSIPGASALEGEALTPRSFLPIPSQVL